MGCFLTRRQQTVNSSKEFGWHGRILRLIQERACLSVLNTGSDCKTEPALGGERGFTLIEVIIFLVVAGIILPSIFIPFMTGLKDYKNPEIISTATFLGEEYSEEND